MKSKIIAVLTLSTLAFFANASARSDFSDMKRVKAEISSEISTEVIDKSDFEKLRDESKEARKELLDKIKLDKDDIAIKPPKPEIEPPTPKTEERSEERV